MEVLEVVGGPGNVLQSSVLFCSVDVPQQCHAVCVEDLVEKGEERRRHCDRAPDMKNE